MQELLLKYENLKKYLRSLESVGIAFSSGVDSTFLLYAAKDAFKDNPDRILAITATSRFIPKRESDESISYCKTLGVKQILLNFSELEIDGFTSNPPNRCYMCKKALFSAFKKVALENNVSEIVEGSNLDDNGDYRPGMIAIKELDIKSPLRKVGFTKNEIRKLSEYFNIPTWNKPSFACLASRFPYGEVINEEKLKMVEDSEDFLLEKGFSQFRVRIHDDECLWASIELLKEEMSKYNEPSVSCSIYRKLLELGFSKVILDPKGYRTGSMNESLNL